ncbi:MAG: lipocalin family protein [Salinivirgaceae bacterium]|nr:lipocalin family protein [Salinivirgaceae bacterium]
MKKIFGLGLLAVVLASFTFVFTSCSKDDDEISSDIIGEWIAESTEIYSNGKLILKDTHSKENYVLWVFRSNKTAEYTDKSTGTISTHETYSFSLIDNTIELVKDSTKDKKYYEYEVSNNVLILTSKKDKSTLVQKYNRKK